MNESLFLAGIFGPFYLAMGLSFLMYTKTWEKVIKEFGSNHLSGTIWAMFEIIIGLTIIQLHNLWVWDAYINITATGWGMLAEGLFFLLIPGKNIKKMLKKYNRVGYFKFGGAVIILAGAYLSHLAYLN